MPYSSSSIVINAPSSSSNTCSMGGLTSAQTRSRTRDARARAPGHQTRRRALWAAGPHLWGARGELWTDTSPTVSHAVDHVRFCPQAVDRGVDEGTNFGPDPRVTRRNAVHVLWT